MRKYKRKEGDKVKEQPVDIIEIGCTCAICGKSMKRITANHLASHNIAVAEYKSQYGELTFIGRVRAQMMRLFDPNRFKWAQQLDGGGYRELEYKKTYQKENGDSYTINYWLTDSVITSHLTGKNTISIFPKRRTQASFLVFDVDARSKSREYALRILDALYECGISREDIHISVSGSKGYHVELFWREPVSTQRLDKFGEHVKQLAGVNNDSVEVRPRSFGNTGIKLPLGYHRKTNQFCTYVDNETLEPIGNVYQYFLAIEPIDTAVLDLVDYELPQQTVSLVIQSESLLPSREQAVESAKSLFQNGLVEPGTRHYAMFKIALWMRDEQGLDRATAERELQQWTKREYERGMLTDSLRKAEQDMRAAIRNVFDQGRYRLGASTRQITISQYDVAHVLTIQDEITRVLYFALILQGKMFYTATGVFSASQRQIEKLTKMDHKKWKPARDYLVSNGYVQIVEKGKYVGKGKKAPGTKFCLPYLIAAGTAPQTASIEVTIDDDFNCGRFLSELTVLFDVAA